MDNFTIGQERRHVFKNLEQFLRCGTDIRHWVYSPDGTLLDSNAGELFFHQIFIYARCHEEMLKHFKISHNPIVISTLLGIEWAASFCPGAAGNGNVGNDNPEIPDRIHVIGPVLSTDFDPVLFRAEIGSIEIPVNFRKRLFDRIAGLPVVPSNMFFNYTLMLHYACTGEYLERKDIIPLSTTPNDSLQKSSSGDKKGRWQEAGSSSSVQQVSSHKKNRQQVYLAEKALLDNVRNGNLNYRMQMEHASQVSGGVNSGSGPVSQGRISVVVFSSLCTRAAIEGGLSPELAYTIGDRYIQEAARASTITGIQAIADRMYDEFIRTVYAHKTKPEQSPQVRACLDYMDANPEEDIHLSDLAGRVNYTEYYLSRKFRQEVGCSINEYMHRVRTERAKLLLSTTTLPVYEIAARLHYSSPTHFSDTFRKVTGIYPNEYRAQNQRV